MIDRIKTRLAQEESGFTLIELLVVMIILAILIAIAVPSYLGFRDRANKSAAQSNVRAVLPSVEAYSSDNVGAGETGADGDVATTGYKGMTPAILQSKYDQGLNVSAYTFGNLGDASTPTYCISSTVGGWTAAKNGPAGQISVGKTFDAATCAVS